MQGHLWVLVCIAAACCGVSSGLWGGVGKVAAGMVLTAAVP
jgi:hypothetical protein